MDWFITHFGLNVVVWWPWVTFFSETIILQFLILYILYNIYFNLNLIYIIFYVLFQIFLFGVFLAFYEMELFTAFLWLAESVVIFICLLLAFYLNIFGNISQLHVKFYSYKYYGLLFLFIIFNNFYVFPSELEFYLPLELITENSLWDDFYESLWSDILTDLYGLYLSYYRFNSFEFIFVGLLLLIGSLLCVNINKFNRINKINSYHDLFLIFDFFKDFVKFIFMRKQNLVDQENHPSSTRIFKKKIN